MCQFTRDYAIFGIEVCTNEIAIKALINKIIQETDLIQLSAYVQRIEHIMTPTTLDYYSNYFPIDNTLFDTFCQKKQMLLNLFNYNTYEKINKNDFKVFSVELQQTYLGFKNVSDFYKHKFGEINE